MLAIQIERTLTLKDAARLKGVSPRTLARWLEEDGIRVPHLGKGSRTLVRHTDVERICGRRTALPFHPCSQQQPARKAAHVEA